MARLALPLLVVALVLAGCGGSKRPKPRLSAKEFVGQADAICAHARTRSGLLARLHTLRPPMAYDDLYAHWLKAEKDALDAAKPPKKPPVEPLFDPRVPLTIAEGKIAGYARRLGAEECAKRAGGTMPP